MLWLEQLQPPKFLRYIFYRLYKHDERAFGYSATPKYTASLILSITHLWQLSFFYLLIGIVLGKSLGSYVLKQGKLRFLIFVLVWMFMVWLFYTYKNKHLNYIKEFKDETKTEKRKSIVYLFIYLFISLCLFVGGLWLLTFNNPNYDHYKTDTQQIEYQEEEINPFELK